MSKRTTTTTTTRLKSGTRAVYKTLPKDEQTYNTEAIAPSWHRAASLPQYDTMLVPCSDPTRSYESDIRMPDDDRFRQLFCITMKPHAQIKLSYVLFPREYNPEGYTGLALSSHDKRAVIEHELIPKWREQCAQTDLIQCLVDHSQSDEYNAMRYMLFVQFIQRERASDVWPLSQCDLSVAASSLLRGLCTPENRYVFLYFCPMIANDIFFYLPHWAKLVFRLMANNWPKLVQLTLLLWRDVSKFCFDDTLADLLRSLKVPVALSRGVQKVVSAEDAALPPPPPPLGDGSFMELDEDSNPEDNDGADTVESARSALVDRSIQEQDMSCGKQGDDRGHCKVKVMSEYDLDTLIHNQGDCRTRFIGLTTRSGCDVLVQMVRLYQRMCGQLKIANTYCNSVVLDMIHAQHGNDLWHTLDVREAAIARLVEMKLIYRFKTTDSDLCLALTHAVRMETWLWRFFNRMISLEQPRFAESHPFHSMSSRTDVVDWKAMAASEYHLDPSQCIAVEKMLTRRLVVINGPPGTGKTTTLARFLRMAEQNGIPCMWQMATPTCLSRRQLTSAMRAAGVNFNKTQVCTAQRIIYQAAAAALKRNSANPKTKVAGAQAPSGPQPRKRITMLGLDESSMWSTKLLYDLLQVYDPVMLVIIGDLDQCTPISWGRPFHVLSDYELLINNSCHQASLSTVHRNSGDIRSLAKSIAENRVSAFTDSFQTIVHHAKQSNMRTVLERTNAVTAFDCESNVIGSFVDTAASIRNTLNELAPDTTTFRPPVSFITYSTDESNKLNERFQTEQRAARAWRSVALLGPQNRFYPPVTRGEDLVKPDFGSQNVVSQFNANNSYRPWSLAVGDYVKMGANMSDLHTILGPETDFIKLWNDRFTGEAACVHERLRALSTTSDDYISNGDAGIVVQMYIFDPHHVCKHIKPPKAASAASTSEAASASASTSKSYYCSTCSAASSICNLAGPTFCVQALVGAADNVLLRSWGIGAKKKWLVAVLWVDGTNDLVHVPIPSYDYRKIKPGYSISFFKAQGSQWDNVAFVCSNKWQARGASCRNAYQKRMDRARVRQQCGTYRIDGYWNNRRLFYVAATRARLRTIFIFNLPFRSKLLQLMEHDTLPPGILEDLFSGDFVPDDALLAGMPIPEPILEPVPAAAAAAVLRCPSKAILSYQDDDDDDDDFLMSVDLNAIERDISAKRIVQPASAASAYDDDISDGCLLSVPLDEITKAAAMQVSKPLPAGTKRPHSSIKN